MGWPLRSFSGPALSDKHGHGALFITMVFLFVYRSTATGVISDTATMENLERRAAIVASLKQTDLMLQFKFDNDEVSRCLLSGSNHCEKMEKDIVALTRQLCSAIGDRVLQEHAEQPEKISPGAAAMSFGDVAQLGTTSEMEGNLIINAVHQTDWICNSTTMYEIGVRALTADATSRPQLNDMWKSFADFVADRGTTWSAQGGISLTGSYDVAMFLGWTAMKSKDWDSARRQLLTAIALRPGALEPSRGLGIVFLVLGNFQEASFYWHTVLMHEPNNPYAEAYILAMDVYCVLTPVCYTEIYPDYVFRSNLIEIEEDEERNAHDDATSSKEEEEGADVEPKAEGGSGESETEWTDDVEAEIDTSEWDRSHAIRAMKSLAMSSAGDNLNLAMWVHKFLSLVVETSLEDVRIVWSRNTFLLSMMPQTKDTKMARNLRSGYWDYRTSRILEYAMEKWPGCAVYDEFPRVHSEPVFLDLGGNIGYFSLQAASMGCYTISFEPLPMMLEHFRRSVDLNPRFHEAIRIVPHTVSNHSQVHEMIQLEMGCVACSHVLEQNEAEKKIQSLVHRVTSVRVDDVYKEVREELCSGRCRRAVEGAPESKNVSRPVPVDDGNRGGGGVRAIKVDVEGCEVDSLWSAHETVMASADIVHIVIEVCPYAWSRCNATLDDGIQLFKEYVSAGLNIYLYDTNDGFDNFTGLRDHQEEWHYFESPVVDWELAPLVGHKDIDPCMTFDEFADMLVEHSHEGFGEDKEPPCTQLWVTKENLRGS